MEPQEHGPNPGGEQPHGPPPEPVAGGAAGEPGTSVPRPARVHMDRYTAVDEILQAIVDAAPTPPPWLDAWRESTRGREFSREHNPGRTPDPRDRLAVWQAVRDSGVLPEDAGFFLVADQIVVITHTAKSVAVIKGLGDAYAAEMRTLRRRRPRNQAKREGVRRRLHALVVEREKLNRRFTALTAEVLETQWLYNAPGSKQPWVVTHAEYHDLAYFREQCVQDWDQRYAALIRQFGEEQIAQLYVDDRQRFEQRYQAGREYFYPPTPAAPNRAADARPAPDTGVPAYDAFLAVLDRAPAPTPDDLPSALNALPSKPPLPLHNSWTLLGLISQYQRHDWVLRNIFSPLIRDEGEVVWSLKNQLCLEGRVPHQPDWYFGLDYDAVPVCWNAQHRETGELITVEAREVKLMEWEPLRDDDSDVDEAPVWIDDPLCLEDVEPDRAAFRWMVEKFCVRETWTSEDLYCGGLKAVEFSQAVQRLVRQLWDRRDMVAAFHAGWAEPARRVWLAALLGDWLAAHAAALTLGDPAVAAQTECRAQWWLREQEGVPPGVMWSRYMDDAALETLLRQGFEPLVQAARERCKGEGSSIGCHALCLALDKDLPGWEAEAGSVFKKFCSRHGESWQIRGAYYLLRRGIKTQEVALALARHFGRFPEQLDDWNRDAVLQIARHDEKLGKKLLRQALRAPVEAIRVCAAAGLAALDRPWAVEVLEEALERGQPKAVRACCRLAIEALQAQGWGEHAEAGPAPPASDGVRRLCCVRRVEGLDDPESDDEDSDLHDERDPAVYEDNWGRGKDGERGPYVRYNGTLRELFEDQVEKARRWLYDWQSSKPWLC